LRSVKSGVAPCGIISMGSGSNSCSSKRTRVNSCHRYGETAARPIYIYIFTYIHTYMCICVNIYAYIFSSSSSGNMNSTSSRNIPRAGAIPVVLLQPCVNNAQKLRSQPIGSNWRQHPAVLFACAVVVVFVVEVVVVVVVVVV